MTRSETLSTQFEFIQTTGRVFGLPDVIDRRQFTQWPRSMARGQWLPWPRKW
jgi:hypothetical protein